LLAATTCVEDVLIGRTGLLLLSAAAYSLGVGYIAHGAPVANPGCSALSVAFMEAVEPVVEAVTDGRPAAVPRAARRARAWWAAHRAQFADTSSVAPALRELGEHAAARQPLLAARAAVQASSAAVDACPTASDLESSTARLDLCGMAGWLRGHGVAVDFPRGIPESERAIVAALRGRGHAALASRLAEDVTATMAIPVGERGDVRGANRLLARVDEVESILH
jgi:hypothetical protein